MALISEKFKADTTGNAIHIRPIVVIANKDEANGLYEIKDAYSTDNQSILDHNGKRIYVKGILNKISSILGMFGGMAGKLIRISGTTEERIEQVKANLA